MTVNEAASALGSIRTAKKSASSRRNMLIARATPRVLKPCTCGRSPHAGTCPVYRREYRAKNKD